MHSSPALCGESAVPAVQDFLAQVDLAGLDLRRLRRHAFLLASFRLGPFVSLAASGAVARSGAEVVPMEAQVGQKNAVAHGVRLSCPIEAMSVARAVVMWARQLSVALALSRLSSPSI